jgi:hypothetical protein
MKENEKEFIDFALKCIAIYVISMFFVFFMVVLISIIFMFLNK